MPFRKALEALWGFSAGGQMPWLNVYQQVNNSIKSMI
jgi:hypothetical protein